MTEITITLFPALDGVQSDIGTFAWGPWQTFINMPSSLDGVINAAVALTGLPPGLLVQIRIPSQTIEGVEYKEVYSQSFPWEQPVFNDSIIMEEVTPPNGPEVPIYLEIIKAAIPILTGAGLLILL